MLYLQGDGVKIVILESANIEQILAGRPARTFDNSVLIAWTPDPVWLADKIADSDGDANVIGKLIDEAAKRPRKPSRPKHPLHTQDFRK